MKWRRIDRPDRPTWTAISNFQNFEEKTIKQIFKKDIFEIVSNIIFRKKRIYVIEHNKMNKFWTFQPDISKNSWLIRYFILLYLNVSKMPWKRGSAHNSNAYFNLFQTSHNKITIPSDSRAQTASDRYVFVDIYELRNFTFFDLTLTWSLLWTAE